MTFGWRAVQEVSKKEAKRCTADYSFRDPEISGVEAFDWLDVKHTFSSWLLMWDGWWEVWLERHYPTELR